MMNIILADDKAIGQAAKLLDEGHLVAVPTETVYGLAADATNDLAVAKIYETKGRPQFNPLIVHVASVEQAREYVEFTPLAEKLAQAFWPGPLTLVLPRKHSKLSYLVSAGLDTVAVRCPAHPVMRSVIEVLGRPLAAPSANLSGRMSPTIASHVYDGFQGCEEPSLILDGGPCAVGLESTVVDARGDVAVLLRPGGLSRESLEKVCLVDMVQEGNPIASPGMLEKHYAPRHSLRLNATDVRVEECLLAFGADVLSGAFKTLNLSPAGDLTEAAANLFAMLHLLDAEQCSGIAVMPIPDKGLGIAINDRLRRASA